MIEKFEPCSEGLEYYKSKPDFETAWNDCNRGDWMLWIADKLGIGIRLLTIAKGKCAETVIHLMKDQRSKDAVRAAINFGNGLIDEIELKKFASDAYAANTDAIATDATRANAYTAAVAANIDAIAIVATAAAYAAADYAADATTNDYDYAYAYTTAKKYNQMVTANICREILTKEVLKRSKVNEQRR